VGTLAFCLLAVAFKYYGLMVLLPLAILTLQRRGFAWRGVVSGLGLAAVTGGLLYAWLTAVYLTTPNPSSDNAYFVHQQPELLADVGFLVRFVDRYLYRDCGPVLMVLTGVGLTAVLLRRAPLPAPLLGWAITGVFFFVLTAPKMLHHCYYELLMLPPAAMWGAVGWHAWWRQAGGLWRAIPVAVLVAVPLVHTLWGVDGHFQQERGLYLMGRRMNEVCGEGERFAILGPFGGCVTVHYSGRQGWATYEPSAADVEQFRRHGARYLVVYLDSSVPPERRAGLLAIAASWPQLEHGVEIWEARGRRVEYFILRLDPP
jgi:hypothetical protein